MPTPIPITTFAGGELSKRILGRPDLPIYSTGLRTCENFLPFVQGGLQTRPGTRHVASVKTAAERTRFIPFKFGTTNAYVLEFGNLYFRVYYNNAGTYQRLGTVEVTTPYTTAQLQDIQYIQSNDIIYLAHPSHAPRKIIRAADDNWALVELNFNPPPTAELKEAPDAGLTLSTVSGNSITAIVDAATFIGTSDKNKIITAGSGKLVITQFVSTTEVLGDIIDAFDSLTYSVGNWFIQGTPFEQLTPSATGPVNEVITLTAGSATFRYGGDSLDTDLGKYIYINSGIVIPVNAIDVTTAGFENKSLLASGQDSAPAGLAFGDSGTKVYIAGNTNDVVYQYNMTTAWDVSTGSYASKSKDVSSEEGQLQGVFFRPDGTQMFIVGQTNNTVFQYTMSTSWDVSTASYDSKSKDVSAQDNTVKDVSFSLDGTKMYIIGIQNDTVYQYTLSTAWDVSTATYATKSKDVSSEAINPQDVSFSQNGTKMIVLDAISTTKVYQYTLTTAWDVSTAAYDTKSFDVSSEEATPLGAEFGSDDTKLYVVGASSDSVRQYALGSDTVISAKVIKVLSATTATYAWTMEQPIWNSTDGYPSSVVFHDDRLVWGGSTGYPQTIALSVVGDYENHERGANDSDAFLATLNAREVNTIEWILSRQDLIVGTTEAEWAIQAAGAFITPTDAGAKLQTAHGSKSLRPAVIDGSILFFQRLGRKLRELTYDFNRAGYTADDISIMSEHITKGGIEEVGYQQNPLSVLWQVRSDGQMIGLSFDKGTQTLSWHRHILGGAFSTGDAIVESVAAIPHPTDDYDELWMIVKRTVNSATVRYIEVLTKILDSTTLTDYWQVDSGKTFAAASTSTITGMSHLEGQTVTVVNRTTGKLVGASYTVSGGEVDISPATVTSALVGLPFTPKMRPVKAVQNVKFTIADVFIEFLNTVGGTIGSADSTSNDSIRFQDDGNPDDSPPTLLTGVVKENIKSKIDRDGSLYIIQTLPYPMTILNITPNVEGGNA